MTMQDVYWSIQDAIFEFQYKNGKDPDCIFMSKPLAKYIVAQEDIPYDTAKHEGVYGEYHGIGVKVYDCSKPEYYLAQGPGKFTTYFENIQGD